MYKRYLLFCVFAALLIAINVAVNALIMPPAKNLKPVAQKKGKPAVQEPAHPDKHEPAQEKPPVETDDRPPAEKPGDTEPDNVVPKSNLEAPKEDAEEKVEAENPDTAPAIAPRRTTLGSIDPTTGYRMLVTLNNEGAAVERIELNSPHYHELEDRSGYLGQLAPANAPGGGALLRVVGAGTPADLAGLKAGDVIKTVNDKSVATAAEFELALAKTSPGDSIKLTYSRDGEQQPVEAKLAWRPLEVVRPEKNSKPVTVLTPDNHDPLSMLLTLTHAGKRKLAEKQRELSGLNLLTGTWTVDGATPDEAIFRRRLDNLGLEISKRYRLAKAPTGEDDPTGPYYHLELDIEVRNIGDSARNVGYRLEGPTGLPLEGAWYAQKIGRGGTPGLRDVVLRFSGDSPYQANCGDIVDAKSTTSWTDATLDYIAVDTQYFAAAVVPDRSTADDMQFGEVKVLSVGEIPPEKADKKMTDVSFALSSTPVELEPDRSLKHTYRVFAGPKKPALLEHYGNNDATLDDLVYYGWFGWVARPMLWILHSFYALVHNYGIAIVMLTVLVRGGMFPLSRKQAISAQKMQELQPEIKRLQEKFKNPEQRTKAQRELFAKHNYNPFGGCLLMFVQLPIFIGLYRSLSVDVELRQAPLISDAVRWCSNLAAPDMLWNWLDFVPAIISTGFLGLGPYLNILPLMTVGLFIWQQKMFMPPPADEQAALQQKMMSYMMVFIGIMFYKVASGLCLYFIASSLWGIAERKLLPKSNVGGAASAGKNLVNSDNSGNGAPTGKKRQTGRK